MDDKFLGVYLDIGRVQWMWVFARQSELAETQ